MWGRGFKPSQSSSEENSKNTSNDSKESAGWSRSHQRNPSDASIGSASSLVVFNDKPIPSERTRNGSVGSSSSVKSVPPNNQQGKREGSISSSKSAPPSASGANGSDNVFVSPNEQRLKSPPSNELKGQRQIPNSASTASVDSLTSDRQPESILNPIPIL
ncbi:uncharacterized protein LOC102808897, partial [Saccoglossus kowalevskii]|uniref:Uncharacterized protein n=1 Tax=Saccoglossus kowalevskii TaxID=10224 RepID=A0ABM0M1E1_SACKO